MQLTNLQQRCDFLHQCYFGSEKPELESYISRAYRDMNRTLRGIAALDIDSKITIGAYKMLQDHFQLLQAKVRPDDSKLIIEFDNWHKDGSDNLRNHYEQAFKDLSDLRSTVGQAQKWINMTMKYCWVCGGADLQWLSPWFPAAHIPVDEVILGIAKEKFAIPRPCPTWSKWDDYDEYRTFQNAIRSAAAMENKSPLELEFDLWLAGMSMR